MPRFHVLTACALIFVVYFYASIAKLNEDWLYIVPFLSVICNYLAFDLRRRAQPLRGWLLRRAGAPHIFGRLWTAHACSVGGIMFDFVGPLLLVCERTRLWGVLASALFHLCNKLLFDIGVCTLACVIG